jgi:hypothetical protein
MGSAICGVPGTKALAPVFFCVAAAGPRLDRGEDLSSAGAKSFFLATEITRLECV